MWVFFIIMNSGNTAFFTLSFYLCACFNSAAKLRFYREEIENPVDTVISAVPANPVFWCVGGSPLLRRSAKVRQPEQHDALMFSRTPSFRTTRGGF